MAKLESLTRQRKYSDYTRRFFTKLDMAIVKHDQAVRNARIKRGEVKREPLEYVVRCGCGVEGCFIHSGTEPLTGSAKEYWDNQQKTINNQIAENIKKRRLRKLNKKKRK